MHKKQRKILLLTLIIVIIGTNVGLLLFNSHKMEQKSYVKQWSSVSNYDFFMKTPTTGVVDSKEEWSLYFDEELGSFQNYLVKEGDLVSEDDSLYQYQVRDYQGKIDALQQQATLIQNEISSIEDLVNQLSNYQISEPFELESTSEDSELNLTASDESAKYLKESNLLESEQRIQLKQSELEAIETQLQELSNGSALITVTSPYQGIVSNLSEEVENPVITLRSPELTIHGQLPEKDRETITKGMKVEIFGKDEDLIGTGELTSLEDYPDTIDLTKSSTYPFQVTWDQDQEIDLLPGYHTQLDIITEQSLDATSVADDALYGTDYVWVLGANGTLELREINTGLQMDGQNEVIAGISTGELIVSKPDGRLALKSTYVTPIQIDVLPWKRAFTKFDKDKQMESVLFGLLVR